MNVGQQLQQLNSGFSPQQRLLAGGKSARVGSRQHNNTPYQHPASQGGRNQRYADEPGSSRHQHGWDSYHQHKDRTTSRHHDNRGGSGHDDWSNSRNYQDNRWRRYWGGTLIPVTTKKKSAQVVRTGTNPLWILNNLDFGDIFDFFTDVFKFLHVHHELILGDFSGALRERLVFADTAAERGRKPNMHPRRKKKTRALAYWVIFNLI